jgi:hypothetical protein
MNRHTYQYTMPVRPAVPGMSSAEKLIFIEDFILPTFLLSK